MRSGGVGCKAILGDPPLVESKQLTLADRIGGFLAMHMKSERLAIGWMHGRAELVIRV